MLDTFNLLGEAYVHGLMKGEVLKLRTTLLRLHLHPSRSKLL